MNTDYADNDDDGFDSATSVDEDAQEVAVEDMLRLKATYIDPFVKANCCSERDCALEPALRTNDPRSLDSWLALRKNDAVPCFDPNDLSILQDDRFKAIESDVYMLTKNHVVQRWRSEMQKSSSWLQQNRPTIDNMNHPLFVQKVVVPTEAQVHLIGDIHSSLASFINILNDLKENKKAFANNFRLQKNHYIVFLGDIVDRGPFSTESLFLVFCLIAANPKRVFLINGNHEDCETFQQYGFWTELTHKFGNDLTNVKDILNYLPSAIILQHGQRKVQLCHGAVTPIAIERQVIGALSINNNPSVKYAFLRRYLTGDYCIPSKQRPIDNLKWGDFNNDIAMAQSSARDKHAGNVREFGYEYVAHYRAAIDVDAIISGHQDKSNMTMLIWPYNANLMQQNGLIERDPNYPSLYRLVKNLRDKELLVGLEFLAVNTSTAVQSKGGPGLESDCYLTLSR